MLNYNLRLLRPLARALNEKSGKLAAEMLALKCDSKSAAIITDDEACIEKRLELAAESVSRLKSICSLLEQCVSILSAAEDRAEAIDESHYNGEIALRQLSLENLAVLMQDIKFE